MAESTETSDLIKPTYIKTTNRHMGIEAFIRNPSNVSGKNPSIDEIQSVDQKDRIDDMGLFLKENEKPPNEKQQIVIDRAKQYIFKKCNEVGIEVNTEQLSVIMLSQEKMDEFYHEKIGHDPENEKIALGYCSDITAPIAVSSESDPEYLLGERVVHELIHKTIDKKVRTYSISERIDGTFYMISELDRSGLVIGKKVYFDNQDPVEIIRNRLSHIILVGHLLNELPNYFYENAFIKEFVDSPEGRELYKDELQRREKLLEEDPNINENGTAFRIGDERLITISRDNIHFNKEGEIILNDGTIMHQLADTLCSMIGNMEEDNLFTLMLKVKADPKKQLLLKEAVDGVMGKGFYHRLKITQMEYGSMKNLLFEVQQKFYEI